MEMELEFEGGRVKPLTYKIRAMSRETSTQKAVNVLDADLRNYWSTGTNTKEWILLELNEPCLLSHIRIHNKSVLEWEVAAGLRYKPETFVKVRPRCEAPRRDIVYSMNYTPCRYVRLSCLRGSPIAVFFIQLIGISVTGLEPEFQPVVNYLLPQIATHEQDSNDLHLQLLQEITDRLHVFLSQLESELTKYADDVETSTRFLAMLAGPFYPILQIVSERESARCSASGDSDVSRHSQPAPALTVSSNFEPRKSRSMPPFAASTSRSIVFRPDAIFILLRKAFTDNALGTVCKVASKILHYLTETTSAQEASSFVTKDTSSLVEEAPLSKACNHVALSSYSELFGDQFLMPVIDWNPSYTNVLDIGAVEEGILHVLFACAVQPLLCSKLAGCATDFWLALPLIQALLPALRPASCSLSVDDTFSQWTQPYVQHALSKIVSTLSSSLYHPLLHGCAGYLSSFSPSHAKTACVLIDLCSNSLAPWMPQVIAKIDLAVELLEDLLGVVQGEHQSLVRVRAALKYLVLALSGYMDDVLAEFKEAKLRVLFLMEMLETFLEPAFCTSESTIVSAEVSFTSQKVHEDTFGAILQVICAAVRKPSVLPSLEQEWRLGSVPPSVLLSILDPHLELPSEIDYCKSSFCVPEKVVLDKTSSPLVPYGESSLKSTGPDVGDGVTDVPGKADILEDSSLFFAPEALRNLTIVNSSKNVLNGVVPSQDPRYDNNTVTREEKSTQVCKHTVSDSGFPMNLFSLQLDHTQLLDYEICKSRASDFRQLALDLHFQKGLDLEGHNAAIDALILSAECYINPFLISAKARSVFSDQVNLHGTKYPRDQEISELRKALGKGNCNLETISHLERKRDKVFVQILLEAAEMDRTYYEKVYDGDHCPYSARSDEEVGILSANDVESVDAITLVRRNQDLLCNFLIHQLQRELQSLHETLMQALVFLLHCATKLACPPENVIDIILGSAEHLNRFLMSTLNHYKEGNLQLNPERIYRVHRHWMVLQSLVIASSGGSSVSNNVFNVSGCQYNNLIPPSTWICKIPTFCLCAFPLVRYLGWMAVSHNAKGYVTQRLFLASKLSQLTNLLSIFADDLAVMDFGGDSKKEVSEELERSVADKVSQERYKDHSFTVIYPDLSILFPGMQKEFKSFRETILEAVALQLRSLSSTSVPDILGWFSDLCLLPFLEKSDKDHDSFPPVKGYQAKNAKAIILYILEAIISEHMEAVIPEMPKLVQVLGSLCRSSYCDAPFLRSILHLLKPIISYSLCKNYNEEKHLNSDSCLDFESLCFDELFSYISQERESLESSTERVKIALIIFILASVFQDLSFDRKREVIQSSVQWVGFPTFEPTATFYDYLCSFEQLLQICNDFLVENLRVYGLIPMPQAASRSLQSHTNNGSESFEWFPDDFSYGREKDLEKSKSENCHLSLKEMEGICGDIDELVSKLNITIESTWNLHPQLSRNLAICSAKCMMYSRCLPSVVHETSDIEGHANASSLICETFDDFFIHWKNGLEGLAEKIILVQEKRCWEVTSTMVDCLLKVPAFCSLDNVIAKLGSIIENIMYTAPKISWRMQTDRWLSNLFSRGILLHESGICLVELICKMLSHPEPELRFTGLLHLGRLFGLDVNSGWLVLTSPSFEKLASLDNNVVCISEPVLSQLVLNTWDQVVVMASADASLHLKTVAKALLVHYIPFVHRVKLQSFLETADSLFQALGNFAYPMGEGLFAQLSLALISGACLYCPAEDMMLVPQNVWRYIETLGASKTGGVGEMEKRICQALCKVKNEEEEAKEALKEALSCCSSKQFDPEFGNTRESVLQVLANLTSVQSYFDIFAEKMDQEARRELEEAEIEMDILQKEVPLLENNNHWNEVTFPSPDTKDGQRLQQIKDGIRSLEKSRIKECIVERRQKKLSLRQRRQKYLEEAALKEAKLLEELDRQKTSEVEKEIERQRCLELERAKTNELRYNLDLEKEKQTQREIQRDLEQVESGGRPPRREFTSASHNSSRPRDRYRDRESGRSTADGSLRTGTASLSPEMPVNTQSLVTSHTVVLSGSRTFSGQPPTILQARDRVDECSSGYEENLDGSKDSGDAGSTGDPELGSGFDGLTSGLGSSQRHGSRGSKSRHILERRERDGRREGKWERKH